jgi:hypothetical protein
MALFTAALCTGVSLLFRYVFPLVILINAGKFTMDNSTSSPKAFTAPITPEVIAHDVSLILEHHPNIGKNIKQMWGTVGLHHYLNSVIFDERGGRQGFPEDIASALFRIYEAHKSLVPEKSGGDIWDVILGQVK